MTTCIKLFCPHASTKALAVSERDQRRRPPTECVSTDEGSVTVKWADGLCVPVRCQLCKQTHRWKACAEKTYELLPRRKCTGNTMCRATDAKSVGVMRGTLNLCSFSLPIGWDVIPFFFALFHPQLTSEFPEAANTRPLYSLRHAAFTPEKWQLKM